MLDLKPLPGDGRFYCGPAAIASFTGLHPKGEVRTAINQVRGRKPTQGVIGMKVDEVMKVLNLFGLKASSFTLEKRITLKAFAEKYPDFCGIVNVTGHFIAVSGGKCQDNQSGAIYPLRLFSGQRKMVKRYIRVWPAA